MMWMSGRFPPQHFGKLYGLAMALSALVALLQYPCVALVQGPLQGDPFYVSVPCGSTGKWGSCPGREGVLPHGETGVSSHGEMGILVLPHGEMGMLLREGWCSSPRSEGVLCHEKWGSCTREG